MVKNSIEKLKFEKNSENENIATNIYIYRILANFGRKKTIDGSQKN